MLENLSDDIGAIRALVFGVLTEMLKQEKLIGGFQAFTELIILKVLEAHRDAEKDVGFFVFVLPSREITFSFFHRSSERPNAAPAPWPPCCPPTSSSAS